MNYWKWLEDGEKHTQDGGEDMSAHMERYHPEGFNPKTDHCVLIDRDKGVDAVSSTEAPYGKESPHYYEQYSKGVSLSEMETWIKENCGGNTKCLFAEGWEDFDRQGLLEKIGGHFLDFGTPPKREGFENGCRVVFECVKDLRTRFPEFSMDTDWIIPFAFDGEKYGSSSYDRRNGIAYIGIIDGESRIKYNPNGYMHKDKRKYSQLPNPKKGWA